MIRSFLTLSILVFLIGMPALLKAQGLEGVVTDYESNETLIGIVVHNLRSDESTLTDANGHFKIAAVNNDEIEFSFLGYYPFRMRMPDGGNVYRKLSLKKKLFELGEVEIRPDYTPYQIDSIERAKTYQLALSRQRASSSVLGSVFSPMSALAEQFNKGSKQIARFQKNFPKWEDQKFVDTRYSYKEVADLTGLGGDTLAAFIAQNPMNVDFARNATDLEIKMWIKYNYKQWIQKPIVLPPPIVIPNDTADTLKKP